MDLLEPHSFFFELPLYTKVKFDKATDEEKVLDLIYGEDGIDAYNPTLKENTTYFIVRPKFFLQTVKQYQGINTVQLKCSRTKEIATIIFYLDTIDSSVQKIGQYPSIAHFHISKVKDYHKVLDSEKIKELTRAIGLAANGVGIGSFVYLRRIFEHLLEVEHQKAKLISGWNEDLYASSRVADRINLLKDFLPTFLVDNKAMYGILSIGIHSLKEDDCLKYFETVKSVLNLS